MTESLCLSQDIQINPEFQELIPKLTTEEFNQLKENIISEGCRDALVLWGSFLIDGHNRFTICSKNNIEFKTIQKEFKDSDEVKIWMIDNQFARRNLSDYQKIVLVQKRKDILLEQGKQIAETKAKVFKGNQYTGALSIMDNAPKHDTRKEIANKLNWSPAKVARADVVLKKASPELIQKLENQEISIIHAYNEIKAVDKINERKQKLELLIENGKTTTLPINIKLLEGDLFNVIDQIPDNSIDLLNTDPPYMILDEKWDTFVNKENFLDFTEKWLKAVIPKVKDTGRIYISFSQWFQYDFYNILLKNNFFDFIFKQNIIWYYKNNNQPSNRKEYRYMYEPIFYLYGKNAKPLNFTADTYGETQQNVWEIASPQSNFTEGKVHPAQKPIELYKRIIQTGSFENDSVLDCFAGSGTTGMICKQLKRNCILIEKDSDNIQIIRGRIFYE